MQPTILGKNLKYHYHWFQFNTNACSMTTEKDITAEKTRELRTLSGLGQTAFWGAVGVGQSTGCRYESGQTKIPRTVRLLLLATYVSPTGTALADIKAVKATARQVRRDLDKAADSLEAAREALGRVVGGAA